MKTCAKCGKTKPLEEFTPSKHFKSGYLPRCKACRNTYERARYQRNLEHERERKRAAQRRSYLANPQAAAANSRRWERKNPERVRIARQQWLKANPDYFRDWYWKNVESERERSRAVMRQLREAHPELEREWRRRYRANNLATVQARERENTHQRRALKGATSAELAQLMAELVTQPCAYCNSSEDITIDHVVPLSRGGQHEAENLAPACHSCNSSKCALLLSEWGGPPALRNAA